MFRSRLARCDRESGRRLDQTGGKFVLVLGRATQYFRLIVLRATFVAGFVLALAVGVPGAAFGATVSQVGGEMMFEAAAGEANEVTVSDAPGGIQFRDEAAFVVAGEGCEAVDERAAFCPWPEGYVVIHVRVRDGNDVVSAANSCGAECEGYPLVVVRGGEGDDTVSAGLGSQLNAFGGLGDDTLEGGPFDDRLHGGLGADAIDGAGHWSGDIVSYAGHRVPVTVTIDADPHDGPEGEADTVVNVEGAIGGSGDDRLVGDRRGNELHGGPGRDVLRGRASGDWLVGGPGADRIRAGRGRDQVVQGGDGNDWIHGGPGDDSLNGGHSDGESELLDHRGKDTIYGGTGNDYLQGAGGADRLFGAEGRDSISGGRGADVLLGGQGRDRLYAGQATYRLRDGAVDRLFGGTDHDIAWLEREYDLFRGVEIIHAR